MGKANVCPGKVRKIISCHNFATFSLFFFKMQVQEDPILFKALQEEDQKLAETLISRQDYDLTETDTKGYTALHLAVVKKNFR